MLIISILRLHIVDEARRSFSFLDRIFVLGDEPRPASWDPQRDCRLQPLIPPQALLGRSMHSYFHGFRLIGIVGVIFSRFADY